VPFPLYGDENAMERLLFRLLRRDGVDCLTSNDAGNSGLSDEQQLAFAAAEGRVVLTHDRVDFQRLHKQWSDRGKSHAGIIIIADQRVPAVTVHAKLIDLQREREAGEMVNAVVFIRSD